MRPGAGPPQLVPFLAGAMTACILLYSLRGSTLRSCSSFHLKSIADSQQVPTLATVGHTGYYTGNDELFEELWEKNRGVVWMSKEEAHMVVKYLRPDQTMWEWGSGGSTTFFSHFVADYHSIEHDKTWYGTVEERIAADPDLARKVTYQHIPAVPYHRVWPGPPSEGANYAEYIRAVPEHLKVDRFFVDGRVRPQCAIEALFHFRDPADSILFIHDFWDTEQRPHYKLALLFYEMIDTVLEGQSLVVLRAKPDWKERLKQFEYPQWWQGKRTDGSALPVEVIRSIEQWENHAAAVHVA